MTTRFCQGTTLVDGPSAEVSLELVPQQAGNFAVGLTRGCVSSQAYATKFKNAPIRPDPKSLDYDTNPLQPAYESPRKKAAKKSAAKKARRPAKKSAKKTARKTRR